MDIARRTMMKGLVAGGALLAMGVPPWAMARSTTHRRRPVLLVLGGTRSDTTFIAGAQAVARGAGEDTVPVFHLAGRIAPDPDAIFTLFQERKGARLIGIMEDGMYAVFQELARDAGVRLACLGRHAYGGDPAFPSRHAMLSAFSSHSLGATLAARLASTDQSFLVTETILDHTSSSPMAGEGAMPGFSSYHVAGAEPVRLHLSGLSMTEGCETLGLSPAEVGPCATAFVEQPRGPSSNVAWAELVGQAVMLVGLGVQPTRATAPTQVFLCRGSASGRQGLAETFVTFIMDV